MAAFDEHDTEALSEQLVEQLGVRSDEYDIDEIKHLVENGALLGAAASGAAASGAGSLLDFGFGAASGGRRKRCTLKHRGKKRKQTKRRKPRKSTKKHKKCVKKRKQTKRRHRK